MVLGHWGEHLISWADRADLLSGPSLQRRVIDYITGNLYVTAGGVMSHRMLAAAVDVLSGEPAASSPKHLCRTLTSTAWPTETPNDGSTSTPLTPR